ncbi:MAG: hypothetical protein JWQ43_4079, partial [Glaciihabitans sp.]|nr:hypothetical protein [Glaciihabitans sp.]
GARLGRTIHFVSATNEVPLNTEAVPEDTAPLSTADSTVETAPA